jgi:ATP-dependent DNA ligase
MESKVAAIVPRTRDEIFPVLQKLRVVRCPFKNLPEMKASRWGEALTAEKMNQCRWVKPNLVCQVAFVEWTDAGHLRHCTFVAMRDDKKPAEAVRETDGRWFDPVRVRQTNYLASKA